MDQPCCQDDLNHAKKLLRASEADCERLGRERSEAAAQVVKLNEAKALLQQQLDDSASGSVAEKQVRSQWSTGHIKPQVCF